MRLWGIFAALVIVAVVVLGAFYVSGAFSNTVDQGGDGPVIAYVHPSATIGLDNSQNTEGVPMSIVSANAIVDVNAPQAANLFSWWNAKTCNVQVTFTITGVGTISEQYKWEVQAMQYKEFSAEPNQAFGMKTPGTYWITVQLIDNPSVLGGDIRDTYQFSVVV